MQGKKIYQEKLFNNFQLSDRVPQSNFYRRLKDVLHLEFLYKKTKCYYGDSGQRSIDPIVFFKLCLVGYLENIISDRQLIEHCSMHLDILYFVGYNIDETLPWHSTISRTRQLFPEEIFEEVFTHVLGMCVEKGMVSGTSQAIDSAPIKANASMDSLELKVPKQDLSSHLKAVSDTNNDQTESSDKSNKKDTDQELSDVKLDIIKSNKRKKNVSGIRKKGSTNANNKTHYSPTDPDARISVKPGKAVKLNYHSQLSVDTAHHVITDIKAYHANKKDSHCLEDIVDRLHARLWKFGFVWEDLLADTGYSSGEVYAFLEKKVIQAYIPIPDSYKGGPEGFIYSKEEDHYICPNGEIIPFKKSLIQNYNNSRTLKKVYRSSNKQCKGCALAESCLSKAVRHKKITVTYYREEYERTKARLKTAKGKYMLRKRQSTVEPVFGTLTQYLGLRKINTIGIKQANKVMHLSAMAYNLKKYLKFTQKLVKSNIITGKTSRWVQNCQKIIDSVFLRHLNFYDYFLNTKT